MKAKVKYNDFVGSAAADIGDNVDNLNNFLEAKGIDTSRYNAVGMSFYCSYDSEGNISVICKDKEFDNQLVELRLYGLSSKDFFNLFKRLEVLVHETGYENEEIKETLSVNADAITENDLQELGYKIDNNKYFKKTYKNGRIVTLIPNGEGVLPQITPPTASSQENNLHYNQIEYLKDLKNFDEKVENENSIFSI
ncbi:hypothetical protein [Bacteroides congonensis]